MYRSQTYGELELKQIPEKILQYYERNKHYESQFSVVIGTDSQNFSDTKIVTVIAVICEGHGGIYFYEISREPRIDNIRQKLYEETSRSLNTAMELLKIIEDNEEYNLLIDKCHFVLHVDAGKTDRSKTRELIPELVGWIKSCGYDCEVKPDSYVASSIADKLSK